MKTPAGTECKYFYGDYYRGRDHEECRLVGISWTRSLCRSCQVPSIDRDNSCEHMSLKAEIKHPLMSVFQPRVKVTTYCGKTFRSGFDPHIGCGECHSIPPGFEVRK